MPVFSSSKAESAVDASSSVPEGERLPDTDENPSSENPEEASDPEKAPAAESASKPEKPEYISAGELESLLSQMLPKSSYSGFWYNFDEEILNIGSVEFYIFARFHLRNVIYTI